jgi:hypothetical protein
MDFEKSAASLPLIPPTYTSESLASVDYSSFDLSVDVRQFYDRQDQQYPQEASAFVNAYIIVDEVECSVIFPRQILSYKVSADNTLTALCGPFNLGWNETFLRKNQQQQWQNQEQQQQVSAAQSENMNTKKHYHQPQKQQQPSSFCSCPQLEQYEQQLRGLQHHSSKMFHEKEQER